MTRARDLASGNALRLITPVNVTVNSGSYSISPNGAVTFTGASGVVLNNVFTSAYDNYKVITNFTTSGTAQDIYFQLRSGTGVSGAMWWSKRQDGVGGSGLYQNSSQLDYWNMGRTSTNGGYFDIDLICPAKGSPQRKWFTAKSSDADKFTSFTGGFADDYGSYDGFRFTGSSGGVLTGTVRVYGYNNG
jgi:hypothetical protein